MQPYLSEIRIFAHGTIPRGWAACNGATLAINQNQALFALLGTQFGGNGSTTFNLPDLRGAAMVSTIAGNYPMGAKGGAETVTLNATQIPLHTHLLQAQTAIGQFSLAASSPDELLSQPALTNNDVIQEYGAPNSLVPMSPQALTSTGGSTPHANMSPFLTLNICICTSGIYPSRN